MYYLIDK